MMMGKVQRCRGGSDAEDDQMPRRMDMDMSMDMDMDMEESEVGEVSEMREVCEMREMGCAMLCAV
jgi:hypothetical protein